MYKQIIMLVLTFLSAHLAPAQTFSGVVRDAATGEPLSGVSIQRLATTKGTVTNRSGSFALYDLSKGTVNLRISSVGYRPEQIEVIIDGKQDQFRAISLQPTPIQLNQQTVRTTQRVEETDFARPEITTILTACANAPPAPFPKACLGQRESGFRKPTTGVARRLYGV